MDLTSTEFKKIKSLHVTTKLPIQIFDLNRTLIKSYISSIGDHLIYKAPQQDSPLDQYISFYYGVFNEVFIGLKYKDVLIMLGPFLTSRLPESDFSDLLRTLLLPSEMDVPSDAPSEQDYKNYYASLPLYSLGDIRDFITLLGFLFDIDIEKIYSESLHEQVCQNQLLIEDNRLNAAESDPFSEERYNFYYENRILNLVEQGDLELLKKGIADLGCSVIPSPSSNSLRTEKNYTIIVIEKLSSLAIQVGKDILATLQLRDFYIKQLEEKSQLTEILSVRDSAIIHFTKELHDFSLSGQSPMIRSVIQYINLKIYESIKVPDLAKHFYTSETTLRRTFKSETGLNITEYINKRKIAEAKIYLKRGISTAEIAKRLNFYDSSHFHRIFKKYVGITPRNFQEAKYFHPNS